MAPAAAEPLSVPPQEDGQDGQLGDGFLKLGSCWAARGAALGGKRYKRERIKMLSSWFSRKIQGKLWAARVATLGGESYKIYYFI